MEDFEIQPYVLFFYLLPFQVFISESLHNGSQIAAVRNGIDPAIVIGIHGHGLVRTKVLPTGCPDRSPDLQQVDHAPVFHEFFVMDIISDTDRPESTPAVVRTVNRRTVASNRSIQQETIVIRISQVTHKTDQAGHIETTSGFRPFLIPRTDRHMIHVRIGKTDNVDTGIVILFFLKVIHKPQVDKMFFQALKI